MESIKDTIVIDRNVGREISQILIEGDIIVPDVKPDMDVVLQNEAYACIESFDIVNERISFKGKLDINLIYLAKSGEKPVHSINFSAPINDFISIDGIDKNMWADISSEIENIEYKMINDRKVSFRAVLNVVGSVAAAEKEDVVVDIDEIPENQLMKKKFVFNKIAAKKNDRFTIKDELSVPSGKPDISEIIQCCAVVSNKEIKAFDGKVSVSGEIMVSTIYKSDMDEGIIEFMEHEIPFNGTLETDGVSEGMFADVDISVQDKYYKIRPDSDGEDRILEIEIGLGALVNVNYEKELQVLEDAYCIDKSTDIVTKTVEYPAFVCRNKNQFPTKEVVSISDDCPKVLQVFKINGRQHLDNIKVIDDKIIVEGIIFADILYVASDDQIPVYCYNAVVPYTQTIDTKGTRADMPMNVDITVNLEHISFNMLSEREIELRCVLNFNVCVTEQKKIELIVDISFSDLDKSFLDKLASMTVYIVKPGDTLWKIAKRFNTTIEEIVAINDIENPDLIYPGEKFLILKKIPEM